MTFEELKLHPSILKAVAECGYRTPTPIQAKTIPAGLTGVDVMGLAQTGTGKTAAFVLPILQRLMHGPRGRIRALVVAPTRELANQTHEAFGALGRHMHIKSAEIYGGVGMSPQVQRLRRGMDVVVACPGRLLDHVSRGTIDLKHVEVLVLDETDRMFDMGFLPDVRRIISHIPAVRQTLFFSATMPDDIRRLAKDILKDPFTVQVGKVAPANTVSHALYPVGQHLKTPLLLELLSRTDTDSVLVFTRTKHRAKKVADQLAKAGYRAASLQGNMSQNARQAALDGFRDGSYQVLVATDIAARGIDVSSISHVINYDMPDSAETYTHRIGRTGRAAKTGDAFTLVTPEDTPMLRAIERLLGRIPERRKLDGFDYAVPAPIREAAPARPPRGQARFHEKAANKPASTGRTSASRPYPGPRSETRQSERPEYRTGHPGGRYAR